MNRKQRPPRMEAVFRSEEERTTACNTLNRHNLNFSEFTRALLCEGKLPPHTIDFPIYQVAVQFLWTQQQILNNLRYFKVQARLGRIPEVDMPKLEAAIEKAQQSSKAILEGIFSIDTPQNVEKILETLTSNNGDCRN